MNMKEIRDLAIKAGAVDGEAAGEPRLIMSDKAIAVFLQAASCKLQAGHFSNVVASGCFDIGLSECSRCGARNV